MITICAVAASIVISQVGGDKPRHAEDQDIVIRKSLRDVVKSGGVHVPEVVHSVSAEDVWQTAPYCGVNCMYAFLSICDVSLEYSEVKKSIPTTFKGANLLELQKVGSRYGIATEVVKITPGEMKGIKSPFIALLGSASKGAVDGHFVVVCGQTDSSITLIDGTTGHLDKIPSFQFNRSFSGFVLMRSGYVRSHEGVMGYTVMEKAMIVGCLLNIVAVAVMWVGRPPR